MPGTPRAAASAEEHGNLLLELHRIALLAWECGRFAVATALGRLPFFRRRVQPYAVRIRQALERLGLTYLKLGQFLAMRYDVLPRELCQELSRLFDRVAGMPYEQARAIIEEELGGSLDDYFAEFPREPIAAASVAQVYDARLRSGQRVAVKVQRGGLRPIFLADIRNLRRLASLIEALGISGHLSVRGMVDEFAGWTLNELDFRVEAHTADRLRRSAEWFLLIPKVYWRLTTPRVLTMEFVEGISSAEAGSLMAAGGEPLVRTRAAGFDAKLVLHRLARSCLKQVFEGGFFHADLHPGNLFICDNQRVAFLDFGIFGSLTEAERAVVTGQILNLALGNISESFRYYALQLIPTEETDWDRVRQQCLTILRRWYAACSDVNLPIEERHLARYIGAMIEVSRQNGLGYSLNYLLFWRALNSLNSTAWVIDPRFDLLEELRTYFEETQPGVVEQALQVVSDRHWRKTTFELTLDLQRRLATGLENIARNQRWNAIALEAPRRHRARRAQARWLTGSVLLVALASLSFRSHLTWPGGLVFAGLLFVVLLFAQWSHT
jgi:ubiquinone biosynthesis protein